MTMYFLPGDRKRRKPTGDRIVIGGSFRGRATPRGLVPYEEPKGHSPAAEAKKKADRANDVAEAYHFVRDCPNSARERVANAHAEAASVPV